MKTLIKTVSLAAALSLSSTVSAFAAIGQDDKILINHPEVPAFELVIVEGGCTDADNPIKQRSLASDAEVNQCKVVETDHVFIPDEVEMVDTHITICWRDNYVEASPVDCATL